MKKNSRVTMSDVARAANVTTQTVSRAFRNTSDISEETRERILRIAGELHYVMNNTASSLRAGNSRLIVVVYDNLINIYFSIMIDYLQKHLRQRGYSILVLSVSHSRFDRETYEFAVSHNAAGVVSFLEPEPEIGEMVRNFRLPVLIVGRRSPIANIDYIRTDDREGGRLAAAWLAEHGVTRPAYVTIDRIVSCAQDRYSGFYEELARRGIREPVVIDDYTHPLRDSVAELFAASENAPDGVFCFNDMLAFELMYHISALALGRVYIVGYDCIQQEVRMPVRLASLGTDKDVFAMRAVEIIVSAVEEKRMGGIEETMPVRLWVDDAT